MVHLTSCLKNYMPSIPVYLPRPNLCLVVGVVEGCVRAGEGGGGDPATAYTSILVQQLGWDVSTDNK